MSLLSKIRERAKKRPKKIVLPEGDDKRVIKARDYIAKSKMAEAILIKRGQRLDELDRMVDKFFEIRHEDKKDMVKDEIEKLFSTNSVYAAAMMVRLGLADGFVAGANYKTSDVARAALNCIGVDREIEFMSGAFVI